MSNLHDFKKNPELSKEYIKANRIQADGNRNFGEMQRLQSIIHKKE